MPDPGDIIIGNDVWIGNEVKILSGENIGEDNFLMSEYSSIYWLWKNVDANYKGLMHYRRIFTTKICLRSPLGILKCLLLRKHPFKPTLKPYQKKCSFNTFIKESVRTEIYIKKIISEFDIITTRPVKTRRTSRSYFTDFGYGADLINIMEEAIEKHYPQSLDFVKKCLESNTFYFGNLEIMKACIFDEYCNFVFDILFEIKKIALERNLINGPVDPNYYRKFGYIGEILTTIFIKLNIKKGLKIKEMAVIIY